MNHYIQGPITEWQGKQLRAAADAEKQSKKVSREQIEADFPKRADWLRARLKERNWRQSDINRHSGPDRKTVRRILNGEAVREDVLDRLARALSGKFHAVDVTDIPSE